MKDTDKVDVVASQISRVGYDKAEKKLYVDFKTGKNYVYHDVEESVYKEMITAESVGSFFSKNVKGKYEYGQC